MQSDLSGAVTVGLQSFYYLLKVAFLILIILYFIFTIVVAGQIDLMSKTLITKVSPLLRLLSWIIVLISLGLIILFYRLL